MLAEYIDGGLEPRERAEVERHLAECAECYENFSEALQATRSLAATPSKDRGRHRFVWLGVAAAVVVAAVATSQFFNSDRRIDGAFNRTLASAASTRIAQARVADKSPWAPASARLRGETAADVPSPMLKAIADLKELSAGSTSAAGHRARALAALLIGGAEEAVIEARAAVAADGATAEGYVLLSAALLEQFHGSGSLDLATSARDAAAAALARDSASTAARFNLALALDAIDPVAAAAAWRDYLAHETDSQWAAEGRRHLDRLSGTPK